MDSIRTSEIMTAIQNISKSVFVRLCRKVGTSQQVAMRRDLMDVSGMIQNQIISGEYSMMLSGSRREGFRLKESDMDIMIWPNNHRVIWELSQSQYYNTNRQTLILCDRSDSPPGFTLLYLLSPSVKMNYKYYISSQITCSAFPLNTSQHGPCASGMFGTTEYDYANCFVSDFWPPSASSWIDRCNSWPEPHVVDDIVKNGCHFVAIGNNLGSHEDHEWRISFSLAEQKLVYAMNHCQFLTYGLLKLFLTEIINNGVGDDDKLLCSYHMKTAVFWVIQQNIIPHWCPQNLLECFWVCFKLILKWVYEGICPNFFIPENNMFLSKIHGDKQHQLFIRLYRLYEKGLAFLLHSPSIKSDIEEVLQNPRLIICTDEQSLISEAEFDVCLFKEIHDRDTLHSLNLQKFITCLHSIEQMIGACIGSPFPTQYSILMLQKLTASVLQNLAFKLHIKTCTQKNKLRYNADKISIYMLKLASKFGFISDMMYIAMYYYKTLRYMEALSVIKIMKVKLAQPYVMCRNLDVEMYTDAIGGQSWPTKMRHAFAWDINLYSKIHYISELIPEQWSSLQKKLQFLAIPPFIRGLFNK